MVSVKLGELFDCVKRGGMVVAENADGELVHVKDAERGLKCNCFCPTCRGAMQAKKGEVLMQHFAHDGDAGGCEHRNTSETVLHKMAKAMLDERLELFLPPLDTTDATGELVDSVVEGGTFEFDEAIVEKWLDDIVPDVLVSARGRRLIVEFHVTHPCGPEKEKKIRDMDVSAIEIDLSKFKDRYVTDLTEEILFEAPRHWIHHAREQETINELNKRREEKERRNAETIDGFRKAYVHKIPLGKLGNGESEKWALRNGLADLIDRPVNGSGCMRVPLSLWQSEIMRVITGPEGGLIKTDGALSVLKKMGWIAPKFSNTPTFVFEALKDEQIGFGTPWGAVASYLHGLKKRNLVVRDQNGRWAAGARIETMMGEAWKLMERPGIRRQELIGIVFELVAELPEDENWQFSVEDWMVKPCWKGDRSPDDMTHARETDWNEFLGGLAALRNAIGYSPHHDLETFGLPLAGEISRNMARKEKEKEEREWARLRKEEERKEKEAGNRQELAWKMAESVIGSDGAMDWMTAGMEELDGMCPLDATRLEERMDDVLDLIDREERKIEAEEKRMRLAKEGFVAELRIVAESVFGNPGQANYWMTERCKELEGLSPEEYVKDEVTRNRCYGFLPTKRR